MAPYKTLESQYARSLIEASLDPLFTISLNGKITDMNRASVNIIRKERDEIAGTDFFNYFTEPQKAREVYMKVFANGSVADSPLTLSIKDGKPINVLFNGSVYKNNAGKVVGAVVVARDTSEQKWAIELRAANRELAYRNAEKEKRADELIVANKELAYQNTEKEKRANELIIANKELAYQNAEKEKRANELIIANKELAFQNDEKQKRADELSIANKELVFQNAEKENRAAELIIANKELSFQNNEKKNRAAELIIADKELVYQTEEKARREIASLELEKISNSLKLASHYARSLIEASLDPLFTINPKGKITDLNNASIEIIGIPREEIIGTDFFGYFTEPLKAREVYKKVYKNGFVEDYPLTIKDAKLTDVLFNGSVYKDDSGMVLGAVVAARDITEQKRVATELNEAIVFAEFATELAEEAKNKAESAALIAENAVKAKQQFLSNMSHEIRTPMNAIIGFTKVLLKTELTSKQKEYLTAIKLSGDALIVLIDDILDLAKVDSGKMTFDSTPFKMALSISAMVHLFETKIRERNLHVFNEYDNNIPEVLVGDPVRLHQIILNLISNAVKFTHKGSITIKVKLIGEDDEKATIEFSVTDTGIGIPQNKLEKIFENFQQATSGTSRLYGGTGLGLAIVKNLVEAQGGSISVKSQPDKGSTFSLILSFLKTNSDAESEAALQELDPEIKNIRVLVVEDIALNQLLMKTLLDDFGFQREIAENGKIAVELLKYKRFDVVLMDLQMPEMNGFEATEYIRNELKLNIPIIALTADVTTTDLEKCKLVGMNDYIAKPVDEKLLYSKIASLVKKPQSVVRNDVDLIVKVEENKMKCIDLDYLKQRTKSNPTLLIEMIKAYLDQTPPLIIAMNQSYHDQDWSKLYSTVHKMIPSFSIMGINTEYEVMARQVQDYARDKQQPDGFSDLVSRLSNVCTQACEELEDELTLIKNDAK